MFAFSETRPQPCGVSQSGGLSSFVGWVQELVFPVSTESEMRLGFGKQGLQHVEAEANGPESWYQVEKKGLVRNFYRRWV